MRDERERRKRERRYYALDDLKACRVCGRYFTKHGQGDVCSVACLEKVEASQDRPKTQ